MDVEKDIAIEILCNLDRTMFNIVIVCEDAMDDDDITEALRQYLGSLDDNQGGSDSLQ
jgi:hypothetical protein